VQIGAVRQVDHRGVALLEELQQRRRIVDGVNSLAILTP
jgi:hypothetical protein